MGKFEANEIVKILQNLHQNQGVAVDREGPLKMKKSSEEGWI